MLKEAVALTKLKKRIPFLQQAFYDRFVCTPERVLSAPVVRAPDARRISVVISHYNRGASIHQPLFNVLNDERVSEVIVVDDGSAEVEFEALKSHLARLDPAGKVRLHRRAENRGAMWTKMECVEQASNPWVILLDADNTLFRTYLDAVFALPKWAEDTIYCPSRAYPHFDFSALGGRSLDFASACALSRAGTLRRVYIINDGNYFLHRQRFLDTVGSLRTLQRDVADVMVVNYLWLSRGNALHVLPEAHYCHRLSPTSFWARTASASRERVLAIYRRFDANLPWDDAFREELESRV